MAEKILTPFQKDFIYSLGKNSRLNRRFYLTGGTALAGYYLFHRYSEDLDFFSTNQIDVSEINSFLKEIKPTLKIIRIDFQQSFNRNMFFIHSKKETLKTEFTYFPFEHIEKPLKKDGILIDSLIDIAVNKMFTIVQNPRARDFIDLYYMLERHGDFSLPRLLKLARGKFDAQIDPINLGTQLLKAKTLQDLPRMLKKTNHEEWRLFFIAQAKRLSKEIFK